MTEGGNMPKKARKKLKSKYYDSGLPRVDYSEASVTDPTARLKRGKGTLASYEEMKAAKSRRKKPDEWKQISTIMESGDFKHLDDFAFAFGIGLAQEASMESADEIAGLLLALIPGKKALGVPDKRIKTNWLDVKKSQKAMDELFRLYGKEFPGPEMTGRAVGLIGQMVYTGGAPAIAMLASSIPRYGLKGSIKLAQKMTQEIQKNPTLAKELTKGGAKNMAKVFNKIKNAQQKTGLTARNIKDAGPVLMTGEGVLTNTMASQKQGIEALKEGAMNPWSYAGPGAMLTLKGLGKAAKLTEEQIYKNWIPNLKRKSVEKKLKLAGYTDAAIEYMVRNKSFFPKGQRSTPEEVVENFKLMIEDGLNAIEDLQSLARTSIPRNPRSHIPMANGMVADVNTQIMDLFKDKRYKPTYLEDPLGEASAISSVDEEDLIASLGLKRTDTQDMRHTGEVGKAQGGIPPADPGEAVPSEIYSIQELKKDPLKLVEVPLQTPRGKKRTKRIKTYEETGSPREQSKGDHISTYIEEPSDPIKVGGQTQKQSFFYSPELPLLSKDDILNKPYIAEYIKNNPGSGKLLNDLLSYRDRLIGTRNLTDQQFVEEIRQTTKKANLNRRAKEEFPSSEDVSRYEKAFGSLRHKFDKRFKKLNKNYAERIEPVAEFFEALKGPPRSPANKSFQETFGIEYKTEYLDDGSTYIRVEFPDPEKTLNALESALLINPGKKLDRPEYTRLLKEFMNATSRSIDDYKSFSAIDAKGDIPGQPGLKTRVPKASLWKDNRVQKTQDEIKAQGESKEFGGYKREMEVQRLFDTLKGQMLTGKFDDPVSANAIVNKMFQDLYGQVDPTRRAGLKPLLKEGEAWMPRRLITQLFMGDPKKQALFLMSLGADKKLKKAPKEAIKRPWDLLQDAEDFAQKMENDPKHVMRFPDWFRNSWFGTRPEEWTNQKNVEWNNPQKQWLTAESKTKALGDREKGDVENLQNMQSYLGLAEDVIRRPVRTLETEENRQLYSPQESKKPRSTGRTLLREPGSVDAGAGENYAPQEFIEEETIEEIQDPEAQDRENRQSRINSFLKQQGAYKRSRRRRQIG